VKRLSTECTRQEVLSVREGATEITHFFEEQCRVIKRASGWVRVVALLIINFLIVIHHHLLLLLNMEILVISLVFFLVLMLNLLL
jgi:hypothetical protein